MTVDTYGDGGGRGVGGGGGEEHNDPLLFFEFRARLPSYFGIKLVFPAQHGTTPAAKTVPCGGAGAGAAGVYGQRRRQLALLLGSISSVPSTAATNLSAMAWRRGGREQSRLGAVRRPPRRGRGGERESGRALSLAAVTALALPPFLH